VNDQQSPYEAPDVEEIAGDEYPISTAAGQSPVTPG
jgi:hypothetical protein